MEAETGGMYLQVGFPGGAVIKNLPAHAGDMGLIPDPERPHKATKPVCHVY